MRSCYCCRDEWIRLFLEAGLAVSKVNNIQDCIVDDQLHHRKMLAMTTNNGREYTVLGNPVKISGFADSNWRPKVPELDEHAHMHTNAAKM